MQEFASISAFLQHWKDSGHGGIGKGCAWELRLGDNANVGIDNYSSVPATSSPLHQTRRNAHQYPSLSSSTSSSTMSSDSDSDTAGASLTHAFNQLSLTATPAPQPRCSQCPKRPFKSAESLTQHCDATGHNPVYASIWRTTCKSCPAQIFHTLVAAEQHAAAKAHALQQQLVLRREGAVDDYFARFPEFKLHLEMPLYPQFLVLAEQKGWGMNHRCRKEFRQAWAEAFGTEFKEGLDIAAGDPSLPPPPPPPSLPPPPRRENDAIDRFFALHPRFLYRPEKPYFEQFERLASQKGWDKSHDMYKMFRSAMTKSFGTDFNAAVEGWMTRKELWHDLCRTLGIPEPLPASITKCKAVSCFSLLFGAWCCGSLILWMG